MLALRSTNDRCWQCCWDCLQRCACCALRCGVALPDILALLLLLQGAASLSGCLMSLARTATRR